MAENEYFYVPADIEINNTGYRGRLSNWEPYDDTERRSTGFIQWVGERFSEIIEETRMRINQDFNDNEIIQIPSEPFPIEEDDIILIAEIFGVSDKIAEEALKLNKGDIAEAAEWLGREEED